MVTLIQDESDETLDITVKRPAYHNPGTGTYYQFGRKDPMPSKDDVSGFGISTAKLDTGADLGAGIKYANFFYCRNSSMEPLSGNSNPGDWCSNNYDNLWTGNSSGIKTIYDPSPVGYKVPAQAAFHGFCQVSESSTDKTKWNYDGAEMSVMKGYNFTPNSVPLFFPAAGFRPYATYTGSVAYTRGVINRLGLNGYFWAYSPKSDDKKYGDALGFSPSYLSTHSSYARADGIPVRPVAE